MNKIITGKFKHGIISYYSNDEYIGKSLSQYGEWSEIEVELIKKILKKNESIIEIGSNIGTHTIPLAKYINDGGTLYSFEPQTQNFNLLSKNINENQIKNVEIFKTAISSKEGEAFINIFDENKKNNYGDAKISKVRSENFEGVTVKTIDQLFYNFTSFQNSIKLIKCDAQGEELNVIIGAKKTIEKHKPFLYLENDNINTSKSLIEKIKSFGYLIFWHLAPLFNPKNFLRNSNNIFSNIVSCNMFCVHYTTKITLNKNWKKFEIKDSNFHPFKKN